MNSQRDPLWFAIALFVVIVAGLGLRYGTNVLDSGEVWDERFIRVPIEDLVRDGWTVEHAIDFKETKGPGFIWPYAATAELVGHSLNDLRLISVMFFIGAAIPLLLIAQRCGVRGPLLAATAIFYILLPYNAVLGQLLMSEASFAFGTLWLFWFFVWGFADTNPESRRVAGPVVVGLILALLLHHRLHALAYAPAICLVAFRREGIRSWPWWLACLLAGLSRIPLWIRWDGPVHSEYQTMHAVGLRLESLTYLAAAMVTFTAIFLIPLLLKRDRRVIILCSIGAIVGALLGVVASPPLVLGDEARYQGVIASAVLAGARRVPGIGAESAQLVMLAVLASGGLASLGALAGRAVARRGSADRVRVLGWLTVVSLAAGWALYAFTQGWVFDRYLLPWAVLLPVLYVKWLPRWAILVQLIILLAVVARHASVWLIQGGPHGAAIG